MVGVDVVVVAGDRWVSGAAAAVAVVWSGSGELALEQAEAMTAMRIVRMGKRARRRMAGGSRLKRLKEIGNSIQGAGVIRDEDDDAISLNLHQPGMAI